MSATDISQLTEMIEEMAGSDVNRISTASSTSRATLHTPRTTRILTDASYSTPHKETDDPNWPTREPSFSDAMAGISLGERPPRYPYNLSPRRGTSRNVSTKIDDHIYTRGFLEGACSDVSVRAFGKTFSLHKIILDRSPFFSMMFSGGWKDSEACSLDLTFDDSNITCSTFEFALSRLYGRAGNLEAVDCLGLLATAAYLDLAELQEQCTNWLLRSLNSKSVARVVNFVMGCKTYGISSDRLREACKALLFRDGFEMAIEEWSDIPVDMVAEVVSSDAFFCPSEIERYTFIISLLRWRQEGSEDIEILKEVLRENIYYMHMSHGDLKKIKADGIVDEHILYKALWDQVDLKEEISEALNPVLGITQSDETEYQVPFDDTRYIGDPLVVPPITTTTPGEPSYSIYPPFRFSAEFDRVSDLKEDTRVYSHTVFYAGSYWNIYIHNKIRARKSRQLGVYLHRVEIKMSGQSTSSEHLGSPPPAQHILSTSPASNKDGLDMPMSGFSESKRPYIDHRSTISTYFKIFCPSRQGTSKIGVTEFCSGPDEFHRSQSWGWKSRGLCAYDEREVLDTERETSGEVGRLKFMVVLGIV